MKKAFFPLALFLVACAPPGHLRGTGTDGRELTEEIVLQTGDGLIGVVDL